MNDNFMLKFPISFQSIPGSPEEEYIGGKSVWKDGKLISYDYGSATTVYLAHYSEEMVDYDQETNQPKGTKVSVRAMAVTVPSPATKEKVIEQARRDIYGLNNATEELSFAQGVLGSYISDPSSDAIKTYEEITRWLEWQWSLNEGLTLEDAQAKVLQDITDYDTSSAVNQFFVGTMPLWLPKDTRMGLMNSITMEKNAQLAEGIENPTTVLWYNNVNFSIPCDLALQMLTALELYALECYNVTAIHKSTVLEMTSVEDVLAFDYTQGYPQKLHFSL